MEYVRSSKARPPLPQGPFLVVGLARSGVAAARALKAHGEAVFGVDSGEPEGLELLRESGIDFETSVPGTDRLDGVATVIKSPGVPESAEVIDEASRRGLPVIGELELGWRMFEAPVVGITGTNGKTTTTELTAHLFRSAGRPVSAAGNVGHPVCEVAMEAAAGREVGTVVCECSSFQLEDSVEFSPEVAVFLNLGPDHLDRHGDMGSYLEAKLRIFANQVEGDVAVLNADDPQVAVSETTAAKIRFSTAGAEGAELTLDGETILVDGEPLIEVSEMQIIGRHNVANAMAGAASAIALGLSTDEVAEGLKSFPPVPHRYEPIAEIEEVVFINDSKATNVDATLAAIDSSDRTLHLILGGSTKGEPFDELVGPVAAHCRGIYLIGVTANEIGKALEPAGVEIVRYCEDLEAAVSEAAGAATPGEAVLLSPACASFDQFKNYEDRGDSFRRFVEDLDG
ncbi:MAG TPA: UDP-N-acetylmuramoyl-L-alanine--D-glutamate ligase [Solirubrobacterales bacterium]|nr:UDP-N-acetylmuramoyl-L-alanine--D-glutamate ligase [Solirubrobacterales bacterium]